MFFIRLSRHILNPCCIHNQLFFKHFTFVKGRCYNEIVICNLPFRFILLLRCFQQELDVRKSYVNLCPSETLPELKRERPNFVVESKAVSRNINNYFYILITMLFQWDKTIPFRHYNSSIASNTVLPLASHHHWSEKLPVHLSRQRCERFQLWNWLLWFSAR